MHAGGPTGFGGAPSQDAESPVQQLQGHQQVQSVYQRFPHHTSFLDRCCHILSKKHRAQPIERLVSGVLKAHQAMDDQYRVFISYRRVDHAAVATKLYRVLEGLGAGRVNAFLDTSSIAYGDEWLEQLNRDSGECHAFIMLAPPDTREWLVYEAAIFEKMMVPGDRLIVIHHPSVSPPPQLTRYNACPAEPGHLYNLLCQILIEPDAAPGLPPINARCSDLVREQAIDIARRFELPDLTERPILNFVRLQLIQSGQVADLDMLLNARVTASDGLDSMFGRSQKTAETLRHVLEARSTDGLAAHRHWLEELLPGVQSAINGNVGDATFSTFVGSNGDITYRPALRAVFEDEDRHVHALDIVFFESLGGRIGGPIELEILRTAIRLATRFRWGILSKLPLQHDHQVKQIERILITIERDSYYNGILDDKLLPQLFESPERERIMGMYKEYASYRNPEKKNGKLDIAFANGDRAEVQMILTRMKEMNKEFIMAGGIRYLRLIRRMW
jgi:hypothetical protein